MEDLCGKFQWLMLSGIILGIMSNVTAFVEGWDFVQTLGEGAYGE